MGSSPLGPVLLLSAELREPGQMCPTPPSQPLMNSGLTGVQPGLGEMVGVAEPCRLGDAAAHGFPLTVKSMLVTAPQSPQWCRTGHVGFFFSFFKTEANCAMKTGHTGTPHSTEGGVRTPVGNIHLGNPLPGGPSAPRASRKGQLQASAPASCPRASSGRRQASL